MLLLASTYRLRGKLQSQTNTFMARLQIFNHSEQTRKYFKFVKINFWLKNGLKILIFKAFCLLK